MQHALRPPYTRCRPLHGSKRSALVHLVAGLVLVMMLIMAAVSAAGLPLQPFTVRRATFAPRAFSVCVDGCCEYFTVPSRARGVPAALHALLCSGRRSLSRRRTSSSTAAPSTSCATTCPYRHQDLRRRSRSASWLSAPRAQPQLTSLSTRPCSMRRATQKVRAHHLCTRQRIRRCPPAGAEARTRALQTVNAASCAGTAQNSSGEPAPAGRLFPCLCVCVLMCLTLW